MLFMTFPSLRSASSWLPRSLASLATSDRTMTALRAGAVEAEVGGVAAGLPGVVGDGLTGLPGGGLPEAADPGVRLVGGGGGIQGGHAGGGPVEECGGELREVAGGGDGGRAGGVGIHDPGLDREAGLRCAAGDECVVDLDGGVGHAERLEQPGAHQVRVAQVGCRGDGLTGDGRHPGWSRRSRPPTAQRLVPGLLDHLRAVGGEEVPAQRRRPGGAAQGGGAELGVSGGVRDELVHRGGAGR